IRMRQGSDGSDAAHQQKHPGAPARRHSIAEIGRRSFRPIEKLRSPQAATIAEQLGVAADEVKPESSFIEDLGADSLDIVELVMALEEEFNIEISDEDAEKIRTVKDVVTYIEAHKS